MLKSVNRNKIKKNKIISERLKNYVDYKGKIWKIKNYNPLNNKFTIISTIKDNKTGEANISFNNLKNMSITPMKPSYVITSPPPPPSKNHNGT